MSLSIPSRPPPIVDEDGDPAKVRLAPTKMMTMNEREKWEEEKEKREGMAAKDDGEVRGHHGEEGGGMRHVQRRVGGKEYREV